MEMKKTIIILILILGVVICRADYNSTFLPDLIEASELIVHIKITKDLNDNFEAEILNKLKGDNKLKRIIIKKFEDWTCAQRWSKYSIGQEALIFLKKHKKEKYWVIMGAGNEGEMSIEKEKLYYKSPIYQNEFLEHHRYYDLNNGKINAVKFELADVFQSIKTYLDKIETINKMFTDKTILEFYPKHHFYRRIINEKIWQNKWGFSEKEVAKRKFTIEK